MKQSKAFKLACEIISMKQPLRRAASLMAAFTLSVFFVSCASAQSTELEYYGIESTINEDLSVKTVIAIRFMQPVEAADFGLRYSISNLSAETNAMSVACNLAQGSSRISCRFSGMTKDKNQLTLTFYSNDGFTPYQGKFSFSQDYNIGIPTKDSSVLIKLPKNSALSEEPANASFTPNDGGILSNGKIIMVFWERTDLSASSDMRFSVSYSSNAAPVASSNSNLLIIMVSGFVIISMISVAVYVKRGPGGSKADVMTSVLNSDEKKVVDILARHGGKSGQKVIVRESDFSKAKVSRLVKNLKERGVVDIEPISGRENRIILKFEKRPEPDRPEPAKIEQKPVIIQKDPVIETESYKEGEEIRDS